MLLDATTLAAQQGANVPALLCVSGLQPQSAGLQLANSVAGMTNTTEPTFVGALLQVGVTADAKANRGTAQSFAFWSLAANGPVNGASESDVPIMQPAAPTGTFPTSPSVPEEPALPCASHGGKENPDSLIVQAPNESVDLPDTNVCDDEFGLPEHARSGPSSTTTRKKVVEATSSEPKEPAAKRTDGVDVSLYNGGADYLRTVSILENSFPASVPPAVPVQQPVEANPESTPEPLRLNGPRSVCPTPLDHTFDTPVEPRASRSPADNPNLGDWVPPQTDSAVKPLSSSEMPVQVEAQLPTSSESKSVSLLSEHPPQDLRVGPSRKDEEAFQTTVPPPTSHRAPLTRGRELTTGISRVATEAVTVPAEPMASSGMKPVQPLLSFQASGQPATSTRSHDEQTSAGMINGAPESGTNLKPEPKSLEAEEPRTALPMPAKAPLVKTTAGRKSDDPGQTEGQPQLTRSEVQGTISPTAVALSFGVSGIEPKPAMSTTSHVYGTTPYARGNGVTAARSQASALPLEAKGHHLEVALQDANLGSIRIRAAVSETGQVNVNLAASSEQTRAELVEIQPLLHASVLRQAEAQGSFAALHVSAGNTTTMSEPEQRQHAAGSFGGSFAGSGQGQAPAHRQPRATSLPFAGRNREIHFDDLVASTTAAGINANGYRSAISVRI